MLLLACCFSAENSRKTATMQQANKNLERTWQVSIDHFMVKKHLIGSEKYFTEPLYTLCIFPLSFPNICATGSD